MLAIDFVNAIVETGRVTVAAGSDALDGADDAARELDRLIRPSLAYDPPALSVAAGGWALHRLYAACQALAHRQIGPEAVRGSLAVPCPLPPSGAACYSVDLTFRLLPDLTLLARGVARADPLVAGLESLARAWPLSSVGMADLGPVDVEPFIAHPSLRRLYADRVIERADLSRLIDPRVREAVREALGAFPHLAPNVAAAMNAMTEEPACP